MASLVEINWKPGPEELRKFGLWMILGFGVIAGVCILLGRETAALIFTIIGGTAGAIGLTGTVVALPLYWLWMSIAFVMGNVVSRLLVAMLFFLLLTPIALAMRAARRDRLQLRKRPGTYWHPVAHSKERTRYERQF